MLNPKKFAQDTPLKGIRSDYFNTIKKECFSDVDTDNNGAYLNSRSNKRVHAVGSFDDEELQNVKIRHQRNDGTYSFKYRNGSDYEAANVNAKEVYIIERYYRQSKSIKGLKRMAARIMTVRIKHNCSNSYIPYIGVIYFNKLLNSDEEILPHGNAKSADASPYTRTSQKTLETEIILLTEGLSVQETYDLVIKESGGPYALSSQSMEPRNKCQLYNGNLKRRRESEPNDAGDIGDDFSSVLRDLKSMHVVESIIVKKHCYFFYLSTERQVEDVVKFYYTDQNTLL